MRTQTAQNIIKYLALRKQASAKEMVDYLGISRQALFKHLSKLLEEGKISKRGKPPIVFYLVSSEKDYSRGATTTSSVISPLIEKNYLLITPTGERLEGMAGFTYWCAKNNLPLEKTVKEYEKTINKYAQYKKEDLIDGGYKLRHTFPRVFLDKIYYLDFYSIERFGKTKLGWLLLYAKQSQNKSLMAELTKIIRVKIQKIITRHKIEAVGFIPPTVKREIQLMAELERNLNLSLPVLDLKKIKTGIIVPQKTLSNLAERVENAKQTFFVADTRHYENVLLIDDAVGSGATLNETATKLKDRKIANKVYGLAITGSFKGFEVISEV